MDDYFSSISEYLEDYTPLKSVDPGEQGLLIRTANGNYLLIYYQAAIFNIHHMVKVNDKRAMYF